MSSGTAVKLLTRTAPRTPCAPVTTPTQTHCDRGEVEGSPPGLPPVVPLAPTPALPRLRGRETGFLSPASGGGSGWGLRRMATIWRAPKALFQPTPAAALAASSAA